MTLQMLMHAAYAVTAACAVCAVTEHGHLDISRENIGRNLCICAYRISSYFVHQFERCTSRASDGDEVPVYSFPSGTEGTEPCFRAQVRGRACRRSDNRLASYRAGCGCGDDDFDSAIDCASLCSFINCAMFPSFFSI